MADLIGSFLGGLGGGAIGSAVVQLRLDSTQYTGQLAKAEGETKAATTGMAGSMSAFSGVAAGAAVIAAGAVAAFAKNAIMAASDEEEALNKVNVVFGESADSVVAFSEISARSFAISKTAALDAASSFGNILQASGLAEDAAASMSVQLVELAGDLASFFNVDTATALEKLRSGLTGQARPLRVFGVLLSETRVKEEAYADGLAATGAELTDAQKLQARYNIILKDTSKAQGDFARTADGLANSMRKAKANGEDLTASIGAPLLAAVTPVVDKVNEFTDALIRLQEVSKKASGGEGMSGFGDALHKVFVDFNPFFAAIDYSIGGLNKLADMAGVTETATTDYSQVTGDAAGTTDMLADASEKAAEALREQKTATQSLAGGMLGLIADLQQLHDDQVKLNELQQEGKKGTAEYSAAVLQLLQDQNGLITSLRDVASNMRTADASSSDIIKRLQGIAAQAGLSKVEFQKFIDSIGGLKGLLSGLDNQVVRIHVDSSELDLANARADRLQSVLRTAV